MFCPECGTEVQSGKFCSKCGKYNSAASSNVVAPTPNTSSTSSTSSSTVKLLFPKNPVPSKWIAAWALLLPGIPQFILGQTPKGFLFVGFAIACAIIPYCYPGGTLALGGICIFSALKAIDTWRSGKPITTWEDVPPKDYKP